MFPLRDFLNRHGSQVESDIPDEIREFFRHTASRTVFRAGAATSKLIESTQFFELAIRGTTQPTVLRAQFVILPDDLSCICIVIDDHEHPLSAITLMKADILWAAVRNMKITRDQNKQLNDE